jgi:hypothetical protein
LLQGSDASSVIFASTPASRKREFPGALPPSLPLSNGTSSSPVPAPTPPNLPVPSPAPAQQPPLHPPTPATTAAPGSTKPSAVPPAICDVPPSSAAPPPASVPVSVPPVTMPQPAAAPIAHHPDSTSGAASHAMRTDSPAVATSANVPVAPGAGQYHHPSYQPLYAPYAVHTPFTGAATITATVPSTTTAAVVPPVTTVATATIKAPSPRGHSPNRERESYR